MGDLYCYNCHGTDFEEDREGTFSCRRCGAMSQDYVPESHEFEHGNDTKVIRKADIRIIKRTVEAEESITLLEMLSAYQQVLREFSIIVADLSGLLNLEDTTRELWFSYLSVWQSSGKSLKSILTSKNLAEETCKTEFVMKKKKTKKKEKIVSFLGSDSEDSIGSEALREASYLLKLSREEKVESNRKTEKLVPEIALQVPSKALLLGFIYLACRMLRSWIIPGDIIRWCDHGLIPIVDIWDSNCVNIHLRERFNRVAGTKEMRFLSEKFQTETLLPTHSNIFYHSVALADMLSIAYPPLNCLLITKRLCSCLGLPGIVHHMYGKLIQLGEAIPTTMKSIDTFTEHYVENLVAVLLMSIKFCPSWHLWSIKRVNNELQKDILHLPSSLEECHKTVPKELRKTQMQQLRNLIPKTAYKNARTKNDILHLSFNKLIGNIMDSKQLEEIDNATEVSPHVVNTEDFIWRALPFGTVGYNENGTIHPLPEQTNTKRKRKRKERNYKSIDDLTCLYLLTNAESEDESKSDLWKHDMQYTVLLERLSSYVHILPSVIHQVLLQLEEELINCCATQEKMDDIIEDTLNTTSCNLNEKHL